MRILSLLALGFLFVGQAWAQVQIPMGCRVKNRPPGYCVWACIETLGRHQKIDKLYNLTDNRAKDPDSLEPHRVSVGDGMILEYYVRVPHAAGTAYSANKKLNDLGVKHKITEAKDLTHINEAMKKDHGCVIFLHPNPTYPGPHAVLLVKLTEENAEFIDPNDLVHYRATRGWFDLYWAGAVITVD
jgi:hypothetical protein